jgi:predicted AlkP superfamily pyrophosphatase or phosphodiesterase
MKQPKHRRVRPLVLLLVLCFFLLPKSQNIVILISLDGFRYEYLNRNLTPTLASFAKSELQPVFPSITFPNHYSIATGLYPTSHGIIANIFNDGNKTFEFNSAAQNQNSHWWLGQPIWVTAVKQGLKSACLFWPGCEAEIQNVRPTYYESWDPNLTVSMKFKKLLQWLSLTGHYRPSFLAMYIQDIDHAGHEFGPDSESVNHAISHVDTELSKFLYALGKLTISPLVKIIIVSDHGMTRTSDDKVIFLSDIISLDNLKISNNNPLILINTDDQTSTILLFRISSFGHAQKKGYQL